MGDRQSTLEQLRLAVLVTVDGAVLFVVRPRPRGLLAVLAHPSAALQQLGVDHVVVLFALAAVWLAAAWVAFGLLAAVGARLPGLAGSACSAVATVALPATFRRVAIGALGVGLLAGPATAAFASPAAATPRAMTASVRQAGHPKPGPSWPTSTPPRPQQHAPDRAPRSAKTVRVRSGDSLWLIAAQRLGRNASPGRIAAYWPQVYAANRSVVGPDPGVVVPGQVLNLPDPQSS